MAKTAFTTSDGLTKKLWEEKLFRDSVKEAYFSRFMGSGPESLVQVNSQLEKNQGDRITFGIRMRLSGSGVGEGVALEGNEEKLTTYSFNVTLASIAHAVRDRGPMDRQRAVFSIDSESKMALQDWVSEKIDQLAFDAIATSPTKIFYKTSGGVTSTGTAATAKAALTTANGKLTPAMISTIKAWAKTGGARSYVPIRPVKVSGKEYYVLLVHPDVMYDLKVDSTFAQAMREAEVRGPENPLFRNATAIWDGVVVHEHENIAVAADGGGSTVPWAKCFFMGQQSLCWAWGKRGEIVARDFDYGREHGFGYEMIYGVGKPVFNSKDYGSVCVYLARTAISSL